MFKLITLNSINFKFVVGYAWNKWNRKIFIVTALVKEPIPMFMKCACLNGSKGLINMSKNKHFISVIAIYVKVKFIFIPKTSIIV